MEGQGPQAQAQGTTTRAQDGNVPRGRCRYPFPLSPSILVVLGLILTCRIIITASGGLVV